MIVGVIGSGAIGPDLAYGFLTALAREAGSKVFLVDVRQEALDAGVRRIHGYVDKGVARGKIAANVAKAVRAALVPTLDLAALAACDYVLEAASEDLAVKRKILESLEQVVRADCLIGFATSGLPRAHIAAQAKHPERCFVNHPFYPAWRALPIEVVSSGDPALTTRMLATIQLLGRVPIATKDVECFAADDVFCNYIAEAARIVESGIATPAQVDAIVNDAIGGGGPFNVMDLTKGNLLVVKCQKLMQSAKTGDALVCAARHPREARRRALARQEGPRRCALRREAEGRGPRPHSGRALRAHVLLARARGLGAARDELAHAHGPRLLEGHDGARRGRGRGPGQGALRGLRGEEPGLRRAQHDQGGQAGPVPPHGAGRATPRGRRHPHLPPRGEERAQPGHAGRDRRRSRGARE
jgi:3-hydroxyacyl-CoA dehydrogenase